MSKEKLTENIWILKRVQDDKSREPRPQVPVQEGLTSELVPGQERSEDMAWISRAIATSRVWCFFAILILALSSLSADSKPDHGFIDSFVRHYEFSPEGRYVHEYHPFILGKTAESFYQLEGRLKQEGFSPVGRNIIFGYEENAIPNYYTDFRRSKIQDEASLKNRVGWSLRLHNRFGFMTGFLFKDLDKMTGGCSDLFTHINVGTVPIFDDRAHLFQDHAFGEATDLVFKAKSCITHSIMQGKVDNVYGWLMHFWQTLYSNALKVSNNQVAGTQDILFSIDYAKYLTSSKLPLFNFFVGPDITYPIEVFAKQDRDVTKNAQTFVRRLVKELEPRDGKKTVYIFCSFVDGVGKSTMLGNIKNWMKFGDHVDDFDHVDNSSSQLAEVFRFKEGVYIADLPAQISHFTYKPDGMVFADVLTRFDKATGDKLCKYAAAQEEELLQKYDDLVKEVENELAHGKQGFFEPKLNDSKRADKAFIRNLCLLKKIDYNPWVPFEYEGSWYLYNTYNKREVRYLTPLGKVTSEGLKNIEADQMFFTDGVRLPLSYDLFLDDLMNKIKEAGVENVVFVDFASMYPRSCRENIRINYLVQQLALLDADFTLGHSTYKDFTSGGELLHLLQNKKNSKSLCDAFKLEAQVRDVLAHMILEQSNKHLDGLSVAELTPLLREKIDAMPEETGKHLDEVAAKKVAIEAKNLEKLYGFSKSYMNVQMLDWRKLVKFSGLVQEVLGGFVKNSTLNDLWQDIGVLSPELDDLIGEPIATSTGDLVKLRHAFDLQCKDPLIIGPAVRMARASWYAAIADMLFATGQHEEELNLQKVKYNVPPMWVRTDGKEVFFAQRVLHPYEAKTTPKIRCREGIFWLPMTKEYGNFAGEAYRMNWDSRATDKGVFAYTASITKNKSMRGYAPVVTRMVQLYQQETSSQTVMATSDLQEQLRDSMYWSIQQKGIKRQAEKNKYIDLTTLGDPKSSQKPVKGKRPVRRLHKIYIANQEQYTAMRLGVRMLATLDMLCKDPDSSVVIRLGNREDFKAGVQLLEQITLPKYFGLFCGKPLFDNYDHVEPYPSWDYWGL